MNIGNSVPDDEALLSPSSDIVSLRRIVRVLETALRHDSALGGKGLLRALSSSNEKVCGSEKMASAYFRAQRQLLLLEAAESKTRLVEEMLDDFTDLINEVKYTIDETKTVLKEEASLHAILSLSNQESGTTDDSELTIQSDNYTSEEENKKYDCRVHLNEELFGSTSITLDMLDGLGEYLSRRDREEAADIKRREMQYIRHMLRARLIRSFTGRHADIISQFVISTGDEDYNQNTRLYLNSDVERSVTTRHSINNPGLQHIRRKTSQERDIYTLHQFRVPSFLGSSRNHSRSEPMDEEIQEQLALESQEQLEWRPSTIATRATDGPIADPKSPKRIYMTLIVSSVMKKPKGISEKSAAMAEQGYFCKQCLHLLRKSPNPIRGWDSAVFCNYTGFYFCEECNDRSTFATIPARVVRQWNFKKCMVSRLAHDFLETHMYSPIICISAVNPDLYGKIWILEAVRRLRAELMALHSIGKQCKRFCTAFYSTRDSRNSVDRYKRNPSLFDSASDNFISKVSVCGSDGYRCYDPSASDNKGLSHHESHESFIFDDVESHTGGNLFDINQASEQYEEEQNFIPEPKRYLCMDCECWSMDNLQELHSVDPENEGAAFIEQWRVKKYDDYKDTKTGKCLVDLQSRHEHILTPYAHLSPLITFLLLIRKRFLRHIVQECVDRCLIKAAHICYCCQLKKGKDLIFTFDTTRRGMMSFYKCSTCGTVYHDTCWREMERKATKLARKWQKCVSHIAGVKADNGMVKRGEKHRRNIVVGVVCKKCANTILKNNSMRLAFGGT
eukprot:Tbor_TRINITY_DN2856_c0_g1::TRINITY_DN2856_c0_g1_i1::g.23248::m.23248